MLSVVLLTRFWLESLWVEGMQPSQRARKNWGICWANGDWLYSYARMHQFILNLPFHIKRRLQLEDLSSWKYCSCLLFPLVLRVWRCIVGVSTFGAVLVILFDDLVLVVRLIAVLRQVGLVRWWRLRWRWWRWRQWRREILSVAYGAVCKVSVTGSLD